MSGVNGQLPINRGIRQIPATFASNSRYYPMKYSGENVFTGIPVGPDEASLLN